MADAGQLSLKEKLQSNSLGLSWCLPETPRSEVGMDTRALGSRPGATPPAFPGKFPVCLGPLSASLREERSAALVLSGSREKARPLYGGRLCGWCPGRSDVGSLHAGRLYRLEPGQEENPNLPTLRLGTGVSCGWVWALRIRE